MTPLQAACKQIIDSCIDSDFAVVALREILNTAHRESKDQDERFQILHSRMTTLRRKQPAVLREAFALLAALLDITFDIDAIMSAATVAKTENEQTEVAKASNPV